MGAMGFVGKPIAPEGRSYGATAACTADKARIPPCLTLIATLESRLRCPARDWLAV